MSDEQLQKLRSATPVQVRLLMAMVSNRKVDEKDGLVIVLHRFSAFISVSRRAEAPNSHRPLRFSWLDDAESMRTPK